MLRVLGTVLVASSLVILSVAMTIGLMSIGSSIAGMVGAIIGLIMSIAITATCVVHLFKEGV